MIDAALQTTTLGYAPGKVILFGEHAVVDGQPAIAATLDRGIRVAVSQRDGDDGPILRSMNALLPTRCKPDPGGEGPERLREALRVVVEMCGPQTRRLQFSVDGAIPAGAGLGSSAALAVALLRGVHQWKGEPLDDDTLIERAFAVEKVFHGTPSGVDHTTIVRGGVLSYEKPRGAAVGTATSLTLPRRLRIAVGVAGPHAGTATAVAALRERARRHPDHYARIFEGIGALSRAARVHLEKGELGAVGELMDLNQGYLNALGVSTPGIEALCAIARERGALGAKLSGAGGGGAVIALVDDDPEPVSRAFAAAGYTSFTTTLASTALSEET
ncbi:MAG: mevalonate kinase [Deltaproteobacteria bacterium]|nr:mevalonate kinase [Deltaproteobacteria bacterium]